MDRQSAIVAFHRTSALARGPGTLAGHFGTAILSVVVSIVAIAPTRAADPARLSNASLHGLEGHRIKLAAPHGGATVLVFYSTECPISNSYSPTFKGPGRELPRRKGQMDRRLRRPRLE